MKINTATPGCIDHHTVDRYTFAHAGVGAVMGLLRAPWWLAVGAAVGWEIVERPLKEAYPHLFHQATNDTMDNAVTDAAAWIMGWAVTRRLTDGYALRWARDPRECEAEANGDHA